MKRRPDKRLEIFGATDPGRVRSVNEDAIAWEPGGAWAVLADGMGGHNAGDVAAALAVELISGFLQRPCDGDDIVPLLEAIDAANREIYAVSRSEPRFAGMGTTLVVACFRNDCVTVAHVGDSRLYRLREGVLEQLTVDHSLRQELLAGGCVAAEAVNALPNGNVITRAVGIAPEVQVDVQQHATLPGDLYLLCSDGLTDLLPDEAVLGVLGAAGRLPRKARCLVEEANQRGGKDNISVILVAFHRAGQRADHDETS